jgi:6-hydroxycyclohex-1-ene-1-carbonyl-CoA dehydrogenase
MLISSWQMTAVGEPLSRTEREMEPLRPGETLVQVLACGVCHTDLGFYYDGVPTRHALPLVLGHEIVGRVLEAPGNRDLVGQVVVVPAVLPCGECLLCLKGRGDICSRQVFPGNDVHGGFASHVVVPARGLCPVRDTGDRDGMARLSVVADAVSTAYEAVRKAGIRPNDFVVVVGAGGVGGFAVQISRALGAAVAAVDVDQERLDLIHRHGATWTLNALEFPGKNLRQKLRELAREASCPAVEWRILETSGTAAGQETAFGLLNHGAVLGVVGYHPGEVTVRLSNLMAFAARAEGTWGCPPERYPAILDMVQSGRIVLEPFVEIRPMSLIQETFEALHNRELRKRPVLIPDFDDPTSRL